MRKISKIIIAIFGASEVLIKLMTPLAVAITWCYYFKIYNELLWITMGIAGLSTLFRAYKIGWKIQDE